MAPAITMRAITTAFTVFRNTALLLIREVRLGSLRRALRQFGRLDVLGRYVAGERLQESADRTHLGIAQLLAELVFRHLHDGGVQGGNLAVVEVGPGLLHVPQGRYLERHLVGIALGDLEAAFV